MLCRDVVPQCLKLLSNANSAAAFYLPPLHFVGRGAGGVGSSRCQHLIHLIQNRIGLVTKQLPEFAQTARGVERAQVKIFAVDVKRVRHKIFDHAQPRHLLFVELQLARLLVEHPFLKLRSTVLS
jgi:hypothetical protein